MGEVDRLIIHANMYNITMMDEWHYNYALFSMKWLNEEHLPYEDEEKLCIQL